MFSPSSIISGGLGSWGDTSSVITLGYGIGAEVPVVERSNRGGGWPDEPVKRRKAYKKLKKEYWELPFTLLEEEKIVVEEKLDSLHQELHEAYAKPSIYEGLNELIVALQEAIQYERLKLEVIANVVETKPLEAIDVKPKRKLSKEEEASIAMYLMYDE